MIQSKSRIKQSTQGEKKYQSDGVSDWDLSRSILVIIIIKQQQFFEEQPRSVRNQPDEKSRAKLNENVSCEKRETNQLVENHMRKVEKLSCSRSDMCNFYIINHKVHRFSISARSEHPETYFTMALEK